MVSDAIRGSVLLFTAMCRRSGKTLLSLHRLWRMFGLAVRVRAR